MAERYASQKEPDIHPNRRCLPEQEINILLLGPTGVGKSTFINAFANYIVNDTLEQAVNDEIQVIIPSTFSFTEGETFEEKRIVVGKEDEHEKVYEDGRTCTQQCRSFIFSIGDRNLRFIDTPGIGDPRGLEQDGKNFHEILSYISQYEHLNAVFIMLKPIGECLTILFRFALKELLQHVNVAVKNNIVFVFTRARSTFFTPGPSKKVLDGLLNEYRRNHNVEIPFSRENAFLFDNETYRYLSLCKNGVRLDSEQTQSYIQSWDRFLNEYCRLMRHIVPLPLHAVSGMLSMNEAAQLVQKLPRPIAETTRLIEQSIQLAKDHKKNVQENPQISSQGIPQDNAVVVPLPHPQTVCVGEKCCRVMDDGDEKKIEYLHICHNEWYLKGVVQEALYDLRLEECPTMNPEDGLCTICGCHWRQHKHITYEYKTNRIYIDSSAKINAEPNQEMSLRDIDKRISDLREEAVQIQDAYKKLARFLHANSILPINDDYLDYLQYFIREEQMKQKAGARNIEVIASFEKMITDYNSEMELFKKTLQNQKDADDETKVLRPEEVFTLVSTLYCLPINGQRIREQVNAIKIAQDRCSAHREKFIELPAKAASSKLMLQLKDILSRR